METTKCSVSTLLFKRVLVDKDVHITVLRNYYMDTVLLEQGLLSIGDILTPTEVVTMQDCSRSLFTVSDPGKSSLIKYSEPR